MTAPEGYTKLGILGYSDKGVYDANATYNRFNTVYYEGSTYIALKDNLQGVTPVEGEDWRYMAKGFGEPSAEGIAVTDTAGIIDGTINKKTILQTFLDKVGEFIVNKAVTNDNFVAKLTERLVNNGLTTEEGFALDARFGKALQEQIDTQNSNLGGIKMAIADKSTTSQLQAVKNKWDSIPYRFTGVISISTSTADNVGAAFVQKYGNHNYGSAQIIGYGIAGPLYSRLNNGVWTDGVLSTKADISNKANFTTSTSSVNINNDSGSYVAINTASNRMYVKEGGVEYAYQLVKV